MGEGGERLVELQRLAQALYRAGASGRQAMTCFAALPKGPPKGGGWGSPSLGGAAANARGVQLTVDLDIAYERSRENIERPVSALAPYNRYLRDPVAGLPFCSVAATVLNGLNLTFTTDIVPVHPFGEIAGGGR